MRHIYMPDDVLLIKVRLGYQGHKVLLFKKSSRQVTVETEIMYMSENMFIIIE